MRLIRVQPRGPVASIALEQPAGNRSGSWLRQELIDAFERVAGGAARVLVIKANGDFSLGGELDEWYAVPPAELEGRVKAFTRVLSLVEQLDIPTIASVQGSCIRGGVELALACDLLIAARSARFGFGQALAGILTLQGDVHSIAERMGRATALGHRSLSDQVGAAQMARWNLVNRVVEDHALEQQTTTLAQRLAGGPGERFGATKALLRAWKQRGASGARPSYGVWVPHPRAEDARRALRNAAAALSA
jgi:enoyl-CoA hydratase/carnithine racemase